MTLEEQEGPSIEKMRRDYTDYASGKAEEIREAADARRYYHGVQWSAEQIKTLNDRKQPVVTYNRINRKIDGVVGVLERLRQDPKAYARNPQNEEGAELATSVMRYALDVTEWDEKESECIRKAGIEGIGCLELTLEAGDHGDPEVGLSIVDPDTFFYDPRSFRADFSDARYMGVAKWVDLDVAREQFPDQAEALRSELSASQASESSAQVDRERRWTDTGRKRLFLVEHWSKTGEGWSFCIYAGNLVLAQGASPFKDEKNQPACRFLPWSAYVDHEGDRYGFVRNLKSPQDEINARRSKALHIMNSRRVIAEKAAVDDIEKARAEIARPDGYIEVQPGLRFEFDDAARGQELQAHSSYLDEAKTEMENFGPNPALLGTGVDGSSGRAIALLQQAGIAELGPFIKAYRGWKLRVYRAVWNAVKTHWQAERWVRVTDDDRVAQFLQVNGMQFDEYGQPQLVNAIGALDVDIIMDEGADTINAMADTFDTISAMAKAGAQIPPQILFELSSLPTSTKKKVMELLEGAQQPDPAADQAKQLALADAQAKIEKTQSETQENLAQIQKIAADIMRPQPVQQAPQPAY